MGGKKKNLNKYCNSSFKQTFKKCVHQLIIWLYLTTESVSFFQWLIQDPIHWVVFVGLENCWMMMKDDELLTTIKLTVRETLKYNCVDFLALTAAPFIVNPTYCDWNQQYWVQKLSDHVWSHEVDYLLGNKCMICILQAKAVHVESIKERFMRTHVTSGLFGGSGGQGGWGFLWSMGQSTPAPMESRGWPKLSVKSQRHLLCQNNEAVGSFSMPSLECHGDVQSIHSFHWWHVPHSQPKLARFHSTGPRENIEEKTGKKD